MLGKPLALGAVGLIAKGLLYFENGWRFSYGSVNWQEGKLVFSEIDLSDSVASLCAKQVSVSLGARHLQILRPFISLKGFPRWKGRGGDWTIEMQDGRIEEEHLGAFRFSFERVWRHHLGRLILERGDARLSLEAVQEEEEIWVDADLSRFEVSAFKQWIDAKGIFDGRVHLVFQNNRVKRGSAHLEFEGVCYGAALSSGEGMVDWEGELGEGDLFDKWMKTGRLRLALTRGSVAGANGSLQEIQGNLSFTAGVGAKWEFEGQGRAKGEQFPVVWNGRAFLHEARSHWVESEARGRGASLSVKGSRDEEGFRWVALGSGIGAVEGTLAQSLWGIGDQRIDPVIFERGTVDGQGEWLFGKKWAFILNGQNLAVRYEKGALECQNARIEWDSEENGAFHLSGGMAQAQITPGFSFKGEGWEGNGTIKQGVLAASYFKGALGGRGREVEGTGTLGAFQLKARGEGLAVSLSGGLIGDRLAFVFEEGCYEGLTFSGGGWADFQGTFSLAIDRFEGALQPIYQAFIGTEERPGKIQSIGEGLRAEGHLSSFRWFLQAKGDLGDGLGFYCPMLEGSEDFLGFDFRLETPTWDLLRLYGSWDGKVCLFDPVRTHLLGSAVEIEACLVDGAGLASLQMQAPVSWRSLIAAAPIWFPESSDWVSIPLEGGVLLHFTYARDGGSSVAIDGKDLAWKEQPVSFSLSAHEEQEGWEISSLQVEKWTIAARVQKEGRALRFTQGSAKWQDGLEADFSGAIDASFQFECLFPHLKFELGKVRPWAEWAGFSLKGLEGVLEGKGILSRRNHFEADFDFSASNLKASSFDWASQGTLHLRYASDTGLLCSGLDLTALDSSEEPPVPYFSCKIGLLQFKASQSLWLLNHARFRLPPRFLSLLPDLSGSHIQLAGEEEIDFCAEIECPSDFSSISCFVKEVALPVEGTVRPISDLSFSFDDSSAKIRFQLEHQGCPVQVGALVSFGEELSGRLSLENRDPGIAAAGDLPLSVEWGYSKEGGFLIREIEGRFGGVEVSFHALDGGPCLIGSARIDFGQLCKIIPARVAQVFADLKMGKGYELKGTLSVGGGVSFRGLLTGKQIDLFGYQLRTLLAQFEFDPGQMRLFDLKISDSAGMMKIDELIAGAAGNAPWTISIPRLTILELRPSLLQKPGKEPQPAGPLVVRELKIEDFKGLLEDSKTYTASGRLTFINSFRREHTVFDIPSDLLGRIVGLDLELLIPACGILDYELKNGLFHLTNLRDSYSEGNRSEFFLSPDLSPTMDLDGNLNILVSMKQFVLFKLTESFQILIDGKLDDPQFHLQKKRRFLGL